METRTNDDVLAEIRAGGDPRPLMAELYELNRGLLTRWARPFSVLVEFEDLMQECYLALCAAVRGYDSAAGYSFGAYLETAVKRHLAGICAGSGALHLSAGAAEAVRAYRWERQRYQLENGTDPEDETAAALLSWKIEKVRKVRHLADMVTVSIDKPMNEDGAALSETLEDPRDHIAELIDQDAETAAARELWEIVSELPEEQAEVIRQRYRDGRTRADIGRESGKTGGQVARAEDKAMRFLKRKRGRLEDLRDVYGIRKNDTGLSLFNRTWESSVERAVIKRGLHNNP